MKKNHTYMMNGKAFNTMMDIARELGKKRIYTRDFDKYGITVVNDDDMATDAAAPQPKADDTQADDPIDVVDDNTSNDADDTVADDPQDDDKADEPKQDKRKTRKLGTPEQIDEANNLAVNGTLSEFATYIKHFSVDALVQMADEAGVDNWASISNDPIRKMRIIMELKGYYFPNEKLQSKPMSPWRTVSLDDMKQAAEDNGVDYRTNDDPKVQRIYLTQALNEAGIVPDSDK